MTRLSAIVQIDLVGGQVMGVGEEEKGGKGGEETWRRGSWIVHKYVRTYYILAVKAAFGRLHCYGAPSTAADDCDSTTEP